MNKQTTSYWLNIGRVLSGTAVAQFIPVVGSLLLAKIFSPESFGTYSVWLGYVLILSTIATLRYENSFGNEAKMEIRFIGLLTSVFLAFIICIFLFCSILLLELIGLTTESLIKLQYRAIVLVFPAAFLFALINSIQSLFSVNAQFGSLIRIRIIYALLLIGFQLTWSIFSKETMGLIWANCAALLLGVPYLCFIITQNQISDNIFHNIKKYIKKHISFFYFSLPADSVSSVSAQLPLMLINDRFGAEYSGFFAFSLRVLGAPISFIARGVLDVFKNKASESFHSKGSCKTDYTYTLKILVLLAFCMLLSGYYLIPLGISSFFDARWHASINTALILLPLFAFRFIASPLSYVYYLADKQHIDLAWQVLLMATVITVFILIKDYESILKVYTLAYSSLYIVYLFGSYKFTEKD